jgi:hypothetical protein
MTSPCYLFSASSSNVLTANHLFHKKTQKIFCRNLLALIFALPIKKREIKGSLSADGGICHPKLGLKYWEFSSAGSEHLPYKQRVGGSIPSTPTKLKPQHLLGLFLLMKLWEFIRRRRNLPYKQRVGGSIPSTPTAAVKGFSRLG